jgi:hypothetical protein
LATTSTAPSRLRKLRADFEHYDDFKAAHARNGAGILRDILVECGVSDDALTQEVHHLVCAHEVGGDPRAELLKDADSISYFDVNLPLYFEREGWEETRRRCTWGYLRLSERARSIVANMKFGEPLGELMNESIEAAQNLQKSGSPAEDGDQQAIRLPGCREPSGGTRCVSHSEPGVELSSRRQEIGGTAP